MYRIGIDVGGTFTDFALVNETDAQVAFHKVPSTPLDPSEAIGHGITGLLDMHHIAASEVAHIGHGTTVATNLVIERKGAATGLITTHGFRDVLEIGRQVRPHLYDYGVGKPPALVPRRHRIEVRERIDAHGKVRVPLDEDAVRAAAEQFRDAGIEAVTICFLHSYRNAAHERRARDIVREVLPDTYLSLSSDVLPEFREFERLSTTVLNATIGPKMARYLERFVERIAALGIQDEPFTIHSNGGLMSIDTVRRYPVRTCLSGPAAGVVGAAAVGRAIGFPNLVTFDVGGTSTDVSLVYRGEPLFTSNRHVAGYPVRTPMVDIHVIGAGGGSVAWLDDAGSLKVGPHSAGAVPGPVAYARGGTEPTISDAEVALQRLNPVSLLNGRMRVDCNAARGVMMDKVAGPLGLTLEEAAEGILRIANANMSRAIRSVSTERGYALSEFALYAYGGAGPLHALDVAHECGIPVVIVPQEPGTMCARGILLSDVSFDFVRSQIAIVDPDNWRRIVESIGVLEKQASDWFNREGVGAERRELYRVLDARYTGQNFEVQVPMDTVFAEDFDTFAERFEAVHLREYGYNVPGRAIEVINCRLKAVGQVAKAPLARLPAGDVDADAARTGSRSVYHGSAHGWIDTPVFDRTRLGSGAVIAGPAVVEEMSSTTVMGPAYRLTVDDFGNLIIRIS